MNRLKYSLIGAAVIALSACEQTQQVTAPQSFDALGFTQNTFWQESNLRTTEFDALQTRLNYLAGAGKLTPEVNQILYALRGYSYFGDVDKLTNDQLSQLSTQLLQIAQSASSESDLYARFIENYSVLVYRYFNDDDTAIDVTPHLHNLVISPIDPSASQASQYMAWEQMRVYGFLAFEARRNEKIKTSLLTHFNAEMKQQLLALVATDQGWQQEHALWALGYTHFLLEKEDANALDEQVWQALERNASTKKSAKHLFSQRYLVNSFRGKSACDELFPNQCEFIDIDTALPINHRCSESLFIRAQGLTNEQLAQSCTQLISQESDFHQLLATKNKAVANDFNTSLRVVIFDHYSGYNQHGQMLFDINTNNGGMYIEGKPSAPGNQATFYSFKAFWKDDFSVWNLNHEYMHYLDGRFNKYSGFGHFPSHLVWWSEGQAELIAQGDNNPRAIKTAKELAKDKWPSLTDIFATDYSKGSEQIYQWSYLANRYLAEHDLTAYQQLAYFLRTDYFDGYAKLLDSLATKHQQQFEQFVDTLIAKQQDKPQTDKKGKVNKLYRYLYRDYLMPTHLTLNEQHMHIL